MARITEIVSRTEGLKTLSGALFASEIDDTLAGGGPYTLFAPNEDAFSELGTEALIALAADSADLAYLLRSHVVAGRLTLRDLGSLERLKSLEGTDLFVSFGPEGDSYVEEARIVRGDIEADNGVIHIVDLVVLPYTEESPGVDGGQGAAVESGFDLVAESDFDPFGYFDSDRGSGEQSESVAV